MRIWILCFAVLVMGAAVTAPFVPVRAELSIEALLDMKSGISGPVQQAFENAKLSGALKAPDALEEFYANRGFKPLWISVFGLSADGEDFIDLIAESWRHGLNPESYHFSALRDLDLRGQGREDQAKLEVLLSDAYVRLGQDLTGIRVDPAFMKSNKRYWREALPAETLLARLRHFESAGDLDEVEELVNGLAPQGRTYAALQAELVRVLRMPPEPYEVALPIRIDGNILRPGHRDKGVPALRLRLGEAPQTQDEYLYDDRLMAAVIRFQRENQLKDDGIVGAQTLDILNQSREQKLFQLAANLERLRWVEEDKPDKYVLVNVPSAMLWAVEDGRVAFDMPVIVGRKQRATNIFSTEITGVRFNPDWTVPPTIKREDILPRLREDPEYLSHKGMQLVSGRGKDAVSLDPLAFDWANITTAELKELRMIQIPGAHNPLGRIRVLMPNVYNIYLHDTNQPHYFERANRAASSGCVRLKEPEEMAEFILKDRQKWNEHSMREVLASGQTRDVFIQETIPVYVLYYTTWLDESGGVVYGHDLYGFDRALIKKLLDIDGIHIPVDNG